MYNKAIVMGRITADPELRQTPNGVSVTTFSIAVDRPGKEKSTDFLDIVAWRQTAEFICRYFSKGKPILVEGTIQTRQYTDKNGNNRRVWEIVASNVSFVNSKTTEQSFPTTSKQEGLNYDPSVDDFEEIDDEEDSLPFNKADSKAAR